MKRLEDVVRCLWCHEALPVPLAREHHGGFAARPMLQGLARRPGFIFFIRIPGFVEMTLTVREPLQDSCSPGGQPCSSRYPTGHGEHLQQEYMRHLREAEGQKLRFERLGSCCGFEDPSLPFGGGMLDMYGR